MTNLWSRYDNLISILCHFRCDISDCHFQSKSITCGAKCRRNFVLWSTITRNFFFIPYFFSPDFMIYFRRSVISLINSILHLSEKKTSQKRAIHFWNRWSKWVSKGYLKNAQALWCHSNSHWIRAQSALMITWLQLISMMIQLTISFRLIIIINWNRKNVSLSLQLVRFRFESHSIIIKLRTKKVLICVSL